MNQPAAVDRPGQPGKPPWFWIALLAGVLVLATGSFFVWRKVSHWFMDAATGPWAALHEASVAVQTPAGAERYYRDHPRLADRYRTAARFVADSRAWAPKLAALPATFPDFSSLIRAGANINITSSNGRKVMTLRYREVSARVAMRGDELLDLQVE